MLSLSYSFVYHLLRLLLIFASSSSLFSAFPSLLYFSSSPTLLYLFHPFYSSSSSYTLPPTHSLAPPHFSYLLHSSSSSFFTLSPATHISRRLYHLIALSWHHLTSNITSSIIRTCPFTVMSNHLLHLLPPLSLSLRLSLSGADNKASPPPPHTEPHHHRHHHHQLPQYII